MPEAPPAAPQAVHRDSRLDLHELVIRREDEHVIAGRVATERFVALPEIAEPALALLARERSIGDAEEALKAQTGADVDLVGFAGSLVDLGFVRAIDGRAVGAEDEPVRTSLPWLRREHCRWLFGTAAKLLFGALLLAAIVTLALDPDLVPRASDFFWSDHTSLAIAGNAVMFLSGVALHELAHLAAARSVGASGRFSLGTRLNKLAAQTDVTGLWAVPRRQRYRTYLAGMACDLLLLSIAVLTLANLDLSTDLHRAVSAFALLAVFRLGSQMLLYMRTDVYFVLADLLKAKNLMEDAAAYVLSEVRRAARRLRRPREAPPPPDVLRALSPRERRNVRIYAPVMTVGSTAALAFAAVYGVPIVVELYVQGIDAVRTGVADNDASRLADGLVTLGVQGGFQGLFLYVLVRDRGARVRTVLGRLRTAS